MPTLCRHAGRSIRRNTLMPVSTSQSSPRNALSDGRLFKTGCVSPKTMSPKEKGKFEDMAKQDKLRYEREMKNYVPPKGQKKKRFKDPNAPKRPPSAFFLFCADFRPKIKSEYPGLSIGDTAKKLGEMWNSSSAEEKQPYEKKAAKLKEKYDKDIVAYRTKGKVDSGPAAAADDDDNEEEEEEGEEEEEEDEDDDDE
ncbi:high mobility group protein B1b isoform X2 [Oreochromis niloticus]|uniref:high mobility group protein B1b isoform X2 n=1 Tax=Oreochromis niloticus TaxID=8128 RepID=UPI000DF18C28|nr:high mobility group protein B1 isoform X2 [Oreochromis niloticus]CAI5693063.1 unnamed protein product [Mustela putorius furo]